MSEKAQNAIVASQVGQQPGKPELTFETAGSAAIVGDSPVKSIIPTIITTTAGNDPEKSFETASFFVGSARNKLPLTEEEDIVMIHTRNKLNTNFIILQRVLHKY